MNDERTTALLGGGAVRRSMRKPATHTSRRRNGGGEGVRLRFRFWLQDLANRFACGEGGGPLGVAAAVVTLAGLLKMKRRRTRQVVTSSFPPCQEGKIN